MSLDNLPVEWSKEQLGLIVNFIDYRGKTPTKTSEGIPLITAKNIRDGYINRKPREYIAEDAYDDWMTRGIPQLGDLVITTEAPMGNVAILNIQEKFALAQRAICLNFKYNKNISKFLYYYLRSQNFKADLQKKATGTTVQGIKAAELKKIFVPLVPLAEQQEIVRQLDVMLAQVEQIKARLNAIPAILKKFRQSVLADTVSGKLIEQDFSNLDFLKLESLILDSGNGLSKRKGDSGKEVTVLRLADFKDAQRISGNERSILLTEKELQKYKLLQNDILVVRVNGSVDIAGKFILHKDNDKNEAYCDHFIRLRIDQQKLLPEYLLYIANEGKGRDYLVNSLSTSAGQNTINQASIKGLKLRVPDIKYQDMIVQTVEKLFKHSFKIDEAVRSTQKRVNLLTQSILAKAFSGELTAEWREQHQDLITGVNSAESLLAKIQAEREIGKPVKKAKKVK